MLTKTTMIAKRTLRVSVRFVASDLAMALRAGADAGRDTMTDIDAEQSRATIARVVRRLVPFIFLCYVVAYIDRVNIGFAATELQRDLGLSDAAYGLGGGLFFLGYCLFEIPSNLILDRVGARIWIARIMIVLGPRLDGDDVRRRAVELLRDARPARHRRGRVLSRDGAVPDLLGAGGGARARPVRSS